MHRPKQESRLQMLSLKVTSVDNYLLVLGSKLVNFAEC